VKALGRQTLLPSEGGDRWTALLQQGQDLFRSGYSRRRALFYNFLSALTFPLGGALAYVLGQGIDVHFLIALGAGNFLYIAGSDLIPEVKRAPRLEETGLRLASFSIGVALLFAARWVR